MHQTDFRFNSFVLRFEQKKMLEKRGIDDEEHEETKIIIIWFWKWLHKERRQ